ncbi:hypothetical protein PCL_05940 [Purpureocillium lilacinum]|uniref:Uncharacterized protein n=1 Tax=Purpureocillium lilacinum TaxID=33203 RepID=A0A2U3ELC9_PURLI|nr:hypothetical protein PCL_05940 [Purpureocillium lilacinum]
MPRAAWLAHMPFLRGPLRWRALPGAEAPSLAWLSAGKWKPTRPDGAAPLTDPTMHAIPGVPPTHRANFKPTGPPSFPCTSPIQRTCIGGRAESTVQTLEVNRRKIQGSTPAHLHLCLLVFCNELARSLLATRMARTPGIRYATSMSKASRILYSSLMPPRLHLLSRSHQTRPIPGVTPPRPDLGAATSNPQPAQIPARRRGPLCCQQIKQASVATHGSQPPPPPATCKLDNHGWP